MQKLFNRFSQNSMERRRMGQGRKRWISGVIRIILFYGYNQDTSRLGWAER